MIHKRGGITIWPTLGIKQLDTSLGPAPGALHWQRWCTIYFGWWLSWQVAIPMGVSGQHIWAPSHIYKHQYSWALTVGGTHPIFSGPSQLFKIWHQQEVPEPFTGPEQPPFLGLQTTIGHIFSRDLHLDPYPQGSQLVIPSSYQLQRWESLKMLPSPDPTKTQVLLISFRSPCL